MQHIQQSGVLEYDIFTNEFTVYSFNILLLFTKHPLQLFQHK